MYIKINKVSKQEVGIWWVQKRFPRNGVPIWFYLCPSSKLNFRRIFLSNYRWQKSDIWSQASYRYAILWVAFLDPSDSQNRQTGSRNLMGSKTLPTTWGTYMKLVTKYQISASSHFSQQLLMTRIWYLVTSFILVPHFVESVFGPIRFLLPVCWLCWFLYTYPLPLWGVGV
jgi:hypothetical protein